LAKPLNMDEHIVSRSRLIGFRVTERIKELRLFAITTAASREAIITA